MKIQDIDDLVDPLKRKLDEIVEGMDFVEVCDLYDKEEIKRLNFNGLYLIEVSSKGYNNLSEWLEYFIPLWDRADFSKSFTPTTKKSRISKHSCLKEWMPMYLGRSRDVSSRLLQHIELPKEKRTFSLKFEARDNLENINFRVLIIKLNLRNYAFVSDYLESGMRDRLSPIVGKQ